ncbi:MAG: hypothetical protein ABR874_20470, partial [Candidatus Sulfotelmatobacter sp.]
MLKPRTLLLPIFLSGLLLTTPTARALQAFRYSVVSNGQKAGSEVDTFASEGQVDCTFEFNDRGRGPKVAAHYVIGSDGTPARVDITGNDYLKAPVDEHFSVESGMGHWKSTSEDG